MVEAAPNRQNSCTAAREPGQLAALWACMGRARPLEGPKDKTDWHACSSLPLMSTDSGRSRAVGETTRSVSVAGQAPDRDGKCLSSVTVGSFISEFRPAPYFYFFDPLVAIAVQRGRSVHFFPMRQWKRCGTSNYVLGNIWEPEHASRSDHRAKPASTFPASRDAPLSHRVCVRVLMRTPSSTDTDGLVNGARQ